MINDKEIWYSPMNNEYLIDEDEKETIREGIFLKWGIYTYIAYSYSPGVNGDIPFPITITVGIIKDKLTGRTCMSEVNKIRFKT